MFSLCPIDGETLSRFKDSELPPEDYLKVLAHVDACGVCQSRLGRYAQADGALARALTPRPQAVRLAASLSVGAALLASLATNLLLAPKARASESQALKLAAPPSQTLTSFYEQVAPRQ